jgi:predicted MFS family arabinose efflux permease
MRDPEVSDASASLRHAAVRRSVRLAEWRSHWPLLIAATVGMSLSGVGPYSFGVLLAAIHDDTGWSRGAITLGQTISSGIAVVTAPVSGLLMDRFGPRRIAIPGVVLYAIGMAAFALIDRSLLQYYASFVLVSIAFLGLKPLTWTGALAKVFIESRALAFAVAISGIAIAGAIVPSITNHLVQHYGWRGAYLGLGLVWTAAVLPFCLLLPRSLARSPDAAATPGSAAVVPPGVPVGRALRSPVFARLVVLGFCLTIGFSAVILHFVPLLRDRGIDTTAAAGIAGAIGLFSIAGRLIVGVLLDRFSGALVGAVAAALPVVPIALLLTVGHGSVVVMTMLAVLIGLSAGCEMDLLAYLLSRHFGLRNYGTLFGILMSALAVGTALGPLGASLVRDWAGSYDPVLWAVIPVFLLSALAVGTTGPYPEPASEGEGGRP